MPHILHFGSYLEQLSTFIMYLSRNLQNQMRQAPYVCCVTNPGVHSPFGLIGVRNEIRQAGNVQGHCMGGDGLSRVGSLRLLEIEMIWGYCCD